MLPFPDLSPAQPIEWFTQFVALDDTTRFLGVGAVLALALLVGRLRGRGSTLAPSVAPLLPPVGRPGLFARATTRYVDPIKVGGATTEYFEQHIGIVATTGAFKTTLMAQLARHRIASGEAVVVLTGGDSDQLEHEISAAGGYVVRPHLAPATFNAFEGTPTFRAQGWATLFPTNSEAKVYHSAFELACIDHFEQHPDDFTVQGLKQAVEDYARAQGGKLWQGMAEGYVSIRLQLMEKVFGDWLGNEMSINEAVRLGVPLMFVCDSADDPDLNRFSAGLVWQAINYAVHNSERPGTAFVDELGRLPRELVGDQVRTWRRNRWHLVVGTHSEADFVAILGDLIKTWVLGRMTASAMKTRAWAHQLTWRTIPMSNFGAHALERAHFYLVSEARVQTVGVPIYQKPRRYEKATPWWRWLRPRGLTPPQAGVVQSDSPPGPAMPVDVEPVVMVRTSGPVEMPAIYRTERLEDMWLRHVFPNGALDDEACWETTYHLNTSGRPELKYEKKNWLAYMLVLALDDARVMGLDEDETRAYLAQVKVLTAAGKLTVEHECENRKCVRRSHLDWFDRGANVSSFWQHWRERRQAA